MGFVISIRLLHHINAGLIIRGSWMEIRVWNSWIEKRRYIVAVLVKTAMVVLYKEGLVLGII